MRGRPTQRASSSVSIRDIPGRQLDQQRLCQRGEACLVGEIVEVEVAGQRIDHESGERADAPGKGVCTLAAYQRVGVFIVGQEEKTDLPPTSSGRLVCSARQAITAGPVTIETEDYLASYAKQPTQVSVAVAVPSVPAA